MPGNCFSFTVLIRSDPDIFCFRCSFTQFAYNLCFFFWDLIIGSKIYSQYLYPDSFLERSLICPKLDTTRKSFPRNFSMVFAFAGDSTITRFSIIYSEIYSFKKHDKVNQLGTKLQNKPLRFFIIYYFWGKFSGLMKGNTNNKKYLIWFWALFIFPFVLVILIFILISAGKAWTDAFFQRT